MDTSVLNSTLIRSLKHIAVVTTLILGFTAHSAAAQPETDRRTISVNGEGLVRVVPDMARVIFGVVTASDDPETARRENAEASRNAINAVRDLGIEERYIRMEMLRLQPHRVFDEDARRYVERGYEAIRQVVVEIHDVDQLPTMIAEIVQEGANRLESVGYELRDRDTVRNDAIRDAVLKARAKAQLIASTLGEDLGKIRQISEQSYDFPMPVLRMESMQAVGKDAAAPEPEAYAAGELEVRVNVHAVFDIVD